MRFTFLTKVVIVLMIMGIVAVSSNAYADSLSIGDTLKKLPALKQGIAFNAVDSEIEYLSTVEVLGFKGITLEVGFSSNDKVVGVASYKLASAKDLGIDVPIVDLLELNLGVYAGYGRVAIGPGNAKDNTEFSWGPSLTLINVNF